MPRRDDILSACLQLAWQINYVYETLIESDVGLAINRVGFTLWYRQSLTNFRNYGINLSLDRRWVWHISKQSHAVNKAPWPNDFLILNDY